MSVADAGQPWCLIAPALSNRRVFLRGASVAGTAAVSTATDAERCLLRRIPTPVAFSSHLQKGRRKPTIAQNGNFGRCRIYRLAATVSWL